MQNFTVINTQRANIKIATTTPINIEAHRGKGQVQTEKSTLLIFFRKIYTSF